jgi:hypothetical protein
MTKLNSQDIAAEFDSATHLVLNHTVFASRVQARGIAALEELKQRLLHENAKTGSDLANSSCLRLAAEEAASLAWATPFPLLVLPELFAEKAAEAWIRSERQRDVRERSRGLTSVDS